MATQQAPSRPVDNWAPIILGAVLGLIFSGLITAGVTGWQVYRRSIAVQGANVSPTTLSAQPAATTGASASYPFLTPSTQAGNGGAPAAFNPYSTSGNAAPQGSYSAPNIYPSPQETPYSPYATISPENPSGDSTPAPATPPPLQPYPTPDDSEPQPQAVTPGGPT